ncbi:MAG: 2OG-Fe(II) oxygenase [Gammaproteobacteria bacterium]|nr:2OG-Fe(II) oxygenase [Gammaproteobacteria bacterium]NIR83462.1 2OG-Fe(II) oxygenase [Gammaproteobacteria bacterium]NIR91384.1 2OG-Fe(II) oxygenase [Gammaproteobacteria bacterium]NIU04624.1 2OG-Fe(II) oxygenase [Gammaproteobacteria bacterium]NIV51666.1 proline hydroxylase [Gammaproteobacteria bacterium]
MGASGAERSAAELGCPPPPGHVAERVARLDWGALKDMLLQEGYARTGALLEPEECAELAALYPQDRCFRSRVDMARHGFGRGSYSYFAEPLPRVVATLRTALYGHLAPIANVLMAALRREARFPPTLDAFRRRCREAGQCKPTPLLLRYGAGDYNCLHRDLYGEVAFPLQATLLLSRPGVDFRGGEFLLLETRPRQQSRGVALALEQGELVVFPVDERPAPGRRGLRRVFMRHGVSPVRDGVRHALGIIFHDAR